MTHEEYEALRQIDIRTVDPEKIVDIKDVHVDTSLPPKERVLDTIRQMNGNPFVFRCGKMLVKISYTGGRSFKEALEDCLRSV